MSELRKWCDNQGVLLMEDCAHAMFGMAEGRPIGRWGDLAIGSLTKFLPTPEGGCLIINNDIQPPKLRASSARDNLKAWVDVFEIGAQHGGLPGLNTAINLALAAKSRSTATPRVSPAVPAAEAARPGQASGAELVIDTQLAQREIASACKTLAQSLPRQRNVDQRRRNYQFLAHALAAAPGMRPLFPDLPEQCAPYVFPLWVDQPDPGYLALKGLDMPVFRWDRLWPGVPTIASDHGTLWSHHVIQLACHQDLTEQDLKAFAAAVMQQLSSVHATPAKAPTSVADALPV